MHKQARPEWHLTFFHSASSTIHEFFKEAINLRLRIIDEFKYPVQGRSSFPLMTP